MHFDTVNSVVLENVPTPQSRGHGVEGGGYTVKGAKQRGCCTIQDAKKRRGAKLKAQSYPATIMLTENEKILTLLRPCLEVDSFPRVPLHPPLALRPQL